jgi:hypothetical protein
MCRRSISGFKRRRVAVSDGKWSEAARRVMRMAARWVEKSYEQLGEMSQKFADRAKDIGFIRLRREVDRLRVREPIVQFALTCPLDLILASFEIY